MRACECPSSSPSCVRGPSRSCVGVLCAIVRITLRAVYVFLLGTEPCCAACFGSSVSYEGIIRSVIQGYCSLMPQSYVKELLSEIIRTIGKSEKCKSNQMNSRFMKCQCKCKRVQCCIPRNTKIETCLSQLEVAGMILFCCIHCVASNGWRSCTLNKGIPGKPQKKERKKGSVLYHSMMESPGHVGEGGGREGWWV